ncbi:hypothetical protein HPP92_000401 [Vanilla planifolia]|uniref:Probable histone-arginine methyltransferase CARM1-like N-terminal PH domain-containing protein n=1 Tax=Vanilla planifolia TaxID=51239 RepID=A0A835RNR8_VANPL|nr:hypothetical protein HPP92_000401 [Vanilla planifolia]
MEVSCERKPRHHREYPYIEVTELNPSPSSARLPPEATASFSADESGAPQLRLCGSDSRGDVCYVLRSCQVRWSSYNPRIICDAVGLLFGARGGNE